MKRVENLKNKNSQQSEQGRTQQGTTKMDKEDRSSYRGRFQGRGRGQRANPNKNKQDTSQTDAATAKFTVGTARQASDCIKIKKYIINQVKMKYKYGIYIGTALEEGQEYDFSPEKPKPLIIIQVDGNDQEKLEKMGINKSNEIEFQMAMSEYNDKLRTYTENKYKVYSFMWDKGSSQMKQNLESKADYNKIIKNNPFELLKNIEALSYN